MTAAYVPPVANPNGTAAVILEIIAEAQRLGGGEGKSVDALLRDITDLCREAREEAFDEDEHRDTLLSLAAVSLLALLRHDADPGASLDAEPAGRLL